MQRIVTAAVVISAVEAVLLLIEEEDEDEEKKFYGFSEEIVPSFNDTQFKVHFRLDATTFEDLLCKAYSIKHPTPSKRGQP